MPLLLLLLTACAVVRAPQNVKIALFAPFEGRYREIGYNALYAARLAVAQSRNSPVELLAVDAGGTEAVNHARALAQDPQVLAVIALGYDATTPEVLRAFGDLPVLVLGEWGAQPITENVFIFSNSEIDGLLTVSPLISVTDAAQVEAPVVGGEVFALEGFRELRGSLDNVTILSSGTLPDEAFTTRYKDDDSFAPEPGLLATLTESATSYVVYAWGSGSRSAMRNWLAPMFTNGYYDNAHIHRYHYENGELTEDAVE